MSIKYLTPSYLEVDFNTFKKRLQDLMQNSKTFKDYNYEGANITMLIEMLAYLSELNTYYTNKLAKNMFMDTSDIYETVHSMANERGYKPYGYLAPLLNLTLTIDLSGNCNPGDQLYSPAWYQLDTGLTDDDGNSIIYTLTETHTETIPLTASDSYSYDLILKQGTYETVEYTGEDILNNKIILPFYNFDYGTFTSNSVSSIDLYVNGEPLTRVESFTANSSQLDINTKIFKLEYDKYERYNIAFSPANYVPNNTDRIKIILLRTLGPNGDISKNTLIDYDNINDVPILDTNFEFDFIEQYFVKNITQNFGLNEDDLSITNNFASYNSSLPETIDEIKENTKGVISSQYRNVNKYDYINHLQEHADIIKGNAWGEQEINPYNTTEYNKVYLSVFPSHWGISTILTETKPWDTETPGLSGTVEIPIEYSDNYKMEILTHLASRKYLNTYETFVLPELVYFIFDIGIKCKRLYNFTLVKEDVKEKLNYYFRAENRNFNEIIDFKDLYNYIMDTSIISDTNEFSYIKGIDNLIIRDINTFTNSISGAETTIYEYNEDDNYPMYNETFNYTFENVLRPIKLGYNQFPVLSKDLCLFVKEE